jgi:large repetitive protein
MRFTRVFLLVALFALVAVPAAFAIRFTDDSFNMPAGTVGQPYGKTFQGAGGCGPALPYQYSIIGGKLPPGLSLSSSGTIGGTPTAAGSFSFWIDLSDQNPPSESWCVPAEAQREFTITVVGGAPAAPLSINQSALAPKATTLFASYSFQLTAAGGGNQTWSVVEGSLPSGLQLSSSGLISGTPTATGDFTFKVRVTDGSRSATQTYSLTVVQQLKIAPITAPPGEVSMAFRVQPAANGGKAGYKWSASGLPAGVAINAETGELSGRPSAAGTFPVKVTVTDSLGFTDTVDVNLNVEPKLSVLAHIVRVGKVGRAFTFRPTVAGGFDPRAWSIVRGALPAGLHFSKRTGAFSGKPRHAGSRTLVIQVKDALGAVARTTLVLRVKS